MTIQFPANPPLNHTFDYDGKTYLWDGEKWTASISNSFDEAYVNIDGDVMTGDLQVPNLISEGDVQTTSLNGGPLGLRNQLINGDFRIWQRGTDFNPIASGDYAADRWCYIGSDANPRFAESSANNKDVNKVAGSAYTVNVTSVRQVIELTTQGRNSQFPIGSTWTQSFYSDQDLTGVQVPNVRFRITTGESGYSSDWVAATDITGKTWEKGSLPDKGNLKHWYFTFTITGDAQNTTKEAVGLAIVFPGNPSGVSVFSECQLEPGPVATPFEHRPIGLELDLCRRYYQTALVSSLVFNVASTAATTAYGAIPLTTPMRIGSPTIDKGDAFIFLDRSGGTESESAIYEIVYATSSSARVRYNRVSSAANEYRRIHKVKNTNNGDEKDTIKLDAEL